MWNGMKSVVMIHPMESKQQRADKLNEWAKDNGRYVPGVKETRKMLWGDGKCER